LAHPAAKQPSRHKQHVNKTSALRFWKRLAP
jgi:hypothetical protein